MMEEVKVKMEIPSSPVKDRHTFNISDTDIEAEKRPENYVWEELDDEEKGHETFQGRQLDSNQKTASQSSSVTSPSLLYECKICLRIFTSSSSLMAHMLSHKLSLTNIKLSQNNVNRANRRKYVAKDQAREATLKHNHQATGNIKSSKSAHKNQFLSNRVKCSLCSKDFQNGIRLTTHMLRFHINESGDLESNSTDNNFPGPSPKSKMAQKIVCHICSSVFQSKQFLGVHVMSVHREPQVFKSSECSKLLQDIGSVVRYNKLNKQLFVGDRPEGCRNLKSGDGKNLENFQNLKDQSSIMESEHSESYQCVRCQTRFEDGEAFQSHLSSLSGRCELAENPKLQVCPICGKVLKTSLVDHMRIHSGERPHQCNSCPARFKRNHQLKMHYQSIHSDVAMFKCEICGKSFKRKDKLHCHYRTHSDEHPYMCVECGNVFKWKHHLKRHKDNVHGGKMVDENSKQFCCDFCGGLFKWKHHMKRHMRNVHRIYDNKTMPPYVTTEISPIPENETNVKQHSSPEISTPDEKAENICISTVKKETSEILNCQENESNYSNLPNDKVKTNIDIIDIDDEKLLNGNSKERGTDGKNVNIARDQCFETGDELYEGGNDEDSEFSQLEKQENISNPQPVSLIRNIDAEPDSCVNPNSNIKAFFPDIQHGIDFRNKQNIFGRGVGCHVNKNEINGDLSVGGNPFCFQRFGDFESNGYI